MYKFRKRITALISAAAMTTTLLFPMAIASAEEQYLVRDPFYNYGNGYNYYESEHFQFIWGNSGDASKVTQEFLAGNAKNLEDCWNVYMQDLEMAAPSQSVNLSLRDGKHYKTNIYISGTGLDGMQDDWAYMSYDSGGYAYMFCCVDSMQYNPPSWVLPHEFGHVVTAHQLGWNTNKYSYAWWEAMGNWFREQYLYSDYSTDETGFGTDFFETYLKNSSLTFPCGRDYYAAWPFLQYLTENPDNLEGYGSDFMKTMLQQGQVDEYPLDMVERLAPADLKETLGHFAKRIASLDFENGDAYRSRLNQLLQSGSWNWQQIYTMLEPVAGQANTYQVPTERAPQHAGLNIIPLNVTGSTISVKLNGLTDIEGADWRACIVQCLSDGTYKYSELFSDGDTCTVNAEQNLSAAYVSVVATPDNNTYTKVGLPYGPDSEFAESIIGFNDKQQYPYSLTIDGADIKERTVATGQNWWESYHNHSNGGGLVSDSATVDSTVYVAPDAMVLGSAKVTGNVRIEDHAVVQDSATVSDNAVIAGYAIVAENATISGNVRVDDYALVMGRSNISGNAKVIESACVYGEYKMTDYAVAKGMAFCMANGSISGQGAVDGDYYDDGGKTVTKGTAYGWVSAQSYVDALPYTDSLIHAYDFGSDSSLSFSDRYTSTYGTITGNPLWESERTSASGVLTLDGTDDFATLDRSVLYTEDIEIQLAVLPRGNNEGQTILHLGNDTDYIKLVSGNANGKPVLTFSNNASTTEIEASQVLALGSWSVIRIVLSGDSLNLYINGNLVGKATMDTNPDDIASSISLSDKKAAYRLGADNNSENNFMGSVDFVRFFSKEVNAPTETYTGSEEIIEPVYETLIGDTDFDDDVDVFDAIILRRNILNLEKDAKLFAACDINSDEQVDVADAVMLQNYLTGKIDVFPGGESNRY